MNIKEWKEDANNFMQGMLKDSGAKGYCLGLSGGIDSAVVASLAVDAVGKENVFGVLLPCDSTEDSIVDAEDLAKNLGIETVKIDLYPTFEQFIVDCDECDGHFVFTDKALGNIKARLRMTTLYAIAEDKGYLVAGTGNRSELAIGYATKGGDGLADCEVLGSLFKSQVYAVGRTYNAIPENTFTKSPSADLCNGQTDEDDFGFSYDELEVALCVLDNEDISVDCPVEYIDIGIVRKVEKMIYKNEHKTCSVRLGPCPY